MQAKKLEPQLMRASLCRSCYCGIIYMRKNIARRKGWWKIHSQNQKLLGHIFVFISWGTVWELVSFEIFSANQGLYLSLDQ